MSLLHKFAAGGASAPTYVDDVFSAYTYTGTGASNPIVNGVDLSSNGGLLWSKSRGAVGNHYLIDSARGIGQALSSDATAAQSATTTISSFNSNGYTLSSASALNGSAATFTSWTFRKAPKFFDVVTYTGNGTAGRQISHSLGQTPGMVIVKSTSAANSWQIWHRGLTSGNYVQFTTAAQSTANAALNFGNDSTTIDPTSTVFTVGTSSNVNTNGTTYVAYLFAHDTAADGLIQCGSFTTDGSGNAAVSLGWEPQYVLTKKSSTTGDWVVSDASRGAAVDSNSPVVYANTSAAEFNGSIAYRPNATGFSVTSGGASVTNVYLAIRRPNKPPTTGTQVYNAIARTGTGAAATVTGVGFAPDLTMVFERAGNAYPTQYDRLRGSTQRLTSYATQAEVTNTNTITSFTMDGMTLGADSTNAVNFNTRAFIDWFFKRAPQVFDEVCYTGTGVARTVTHNLGVAPEMIILKSRSGVANWIVHHTALGVTGAYPKYIYLNSDVMVSNGDVTVWNAVPTSTTFAVGSSSAVNANAVTFVAYLFATKAGISKVFSYTGNGSSQTIDCGFTTGARFVLIKRTDSTGDWYVYDTVRGYPAGNDPHLSLNTTAAEVTTTDDVDYDATGFIVNQNVTTNLNVTSATYIGLAFA